MVRRDSSFNPVISSGAMLPACPVAPRRDVGFSSFRDSFGVALDLPGIFDNDWCLHGRTTNRVESDEASVWQVGCQNTLSNKLN